MKSMQELPERSARRRYTWRQGIIVAAILALRIYFAAVLIYAPIGEEVEEDGDSGLPGPVPSIVAPTPTP
jgi:hypothetical protein